MTQPIEGPRARYRQQVRDEVQARAWDQISHDGASALSLKAIAGQMGMTAPALYRYYGSRDELLTELILSAYQDLAELIERTAAENLAVEALAQGMRSWALENPQRYLLLYGTPVPGYNAPPAATSLAQRIFAPIHLAVAERLPVDASESLAFQQTVTLWTRMHGVLSLELAGHFEGMQFDPAELFAAEVRSLSPDVRDQ